MSFSAVCKCLYLRAWLGWEVRTVLRTTARGPGRLALPRLTWPPARRMIHARRGPPAPTSHGAGECSQTQQQVQLGEG